MMCSEGSSGSLGRTSARRSLCRLYTISSCSVKSGADLGAELGLAPPETCPCFVAHAGQARFVLRYGDPRSAVLCTSAGPEKWPWCGPPLGLCSCARPHGAVRHGASRMAEKLSGG